MRQAFEGTEAAGITCPGMEVDDTLPPWASIRALHLCPFGLLIATPCGRIRFLNDAARTSAIAGPTADWIRAESPYPFDHRTEPFSEVVLALPGVKQRYLPVHWKRRLWVLSLWSMPSPTGLPGSDLVALVLPRDRATEWRTVEYFVRHHRLTTAESEVLELLRQGQRPLSIARQRSVSEHTVRTQIRSILAKVGVGQVPDLLRLADSLPPSGPDAVCTAQTIAPFGADDNPTRHSGDHDAMSRLWHDGVPR